MSEWSNEATEAVYAMFEGKILQKARALQGRSFAKFDLVDFIRGLLIREMKKHKKIKMFQKVFGVFIEEVNFEEIADFALTQTRL